MMSMSRNYINHKLNIYIVAGMLVMASCSDDFLRDNQDLPGNSSESVSFTASVALAGSSAGSRGATVSYEPLVLTDDDAPDYPLYLHSYEHPYGEDVAEMGEAASRGVQVNSPKDLYDTHKSFAVRSEFNSNGEELVHLHDTRRVNESGDNYVYWMPTDPHRWPSGGRLQFAAVAPYSYMSKLENAVYDENMISFSYTAEKSADGTTDAEAQTDLLAAVATMSREDSKEHDYRVPFTFNHALSAVKFAVRDVLKGKVISVTIRGVKGKGDCIYTADDNSLNGKFVWSNQSADESYTQIFNHPIEDGYANINDPDKDVVLNDKMPEKTFMLIPQVLTDNAEIEVIIERDPDENGNTFNKIKVKGKILDIDMDEWKPGHEYVYTISTSKSNWTYVFEVTGNEAKGYNNIYVYSPGNENFSGDPDKNIVGLGNNAYFDVVSYRYRTNNPGVFEILPWSASHGGSYSYRVEKEDDSNEFAYPEANPSQKEVTSTQWITDNSKTPLSGNGSTKKERHNLSFLPHYVSTDWKGDETMQGYPPYSGYDENHPYDLSTFGGKRLRTTANCYIVDRGGWYMLPLVYGNAVKNGDTNSSAYTTESKLVPTYYDPNGKNIKTSGGVLKVLKDYNNNDITQPYIKNVNDNCKAMLIWEDAYNMIDKVDLYYDEVSNEYMLRFHVASNDLQQGNAILALLDKENGTVMWSWHIWATEHWIDKNTGLPHVFDTSNSTFSTFKANEKTGIRECGDVIVSYNQGSKGPFYMAPYNLGWCDPKKVLYLKRKNTMDFVQKLPDGETPTGETAKLPIIQDGITIDYKFANNTYYQWGRKDPMRGYFNHESDYKVVFGSRVSATGQQGNITIGDAIKNPQIFYGKSGDNYSDQEDWLKDQGYLNLWNNHSGISGDRIYSEAVIPTNTACDNFWVHTKTVYDPSPAGYMVPNAGIFHVINKETPKDPYNWYNIALSLDGFKTTINGAYIDDFTYKIWGDGAADNNNAIFFSSTGNRWWAGGENQGKEISYAWSNRSCIGNVNSAGNFQREAFGLALGKEGADSYGIRAQFLGRRAMGRPVRAIREP